VAKVAHLNLSGWQKLDRRRLYLANCDEVVVQRSLQSLFSQVIFVVSQIYISPDLC